MQLDFDVEVLMGTIQDAALRRSRRWPSSTDCGRRARLSSPAR